MLTSWIAIFALSATPEAAAQDVAPVDTSIHLQIDLVPPSYKTGETWPRTLVNGADFLEPLSPLTAFRRGDAGRLVLDTALPYGMLITSFAAQGTDRATLHEIGRWHWVGLDDPQDNYPILYGLTALAGLSSFLPAPEDAGEYSWLLRLDRLTVFVAAVGLANAEAELLKPVFHRQRPGTTSRSSRPSGHAATAFASMAFLSDVLRDTLRPQDESNVPLRIAEELATAIPYLGAGYVALERVHHKKHFLTDTLLGGALGVFTTKMLWNWSFLRTELGSGWASGFSVAWASGGCEVAWTARF